MRNVDTGWEDAGDVWAKFVRSGNDFYRNYMTLPAFLQLIGDAEGLSVLDLGCGEGYVARILARGGAHVTGVDISPSMIAEACKEEAVEPLGICYIESDARSMPMLVDDTFNAVISFQTLMDIEDIHSVVSEVARLLKPGGCFHAMLLHPCFANRFRGEEKIIGWEADQYLKVVDYFDGSPTTWLWQNRVERSFKTTQYHRTLSEYVNILAENGLFIERMVEPKPISEGVRLYPILKRFERVPQSLAFTAVKRE
jgi:ubiquinone/menaquinone biosynthesis C-methylase UbiE